MLTVEELYLLLTRSNGDPEVFGLRFGPGLNAALLTDLVDATRVTVLGDAPPRLRVLSTTPTGALVADFGLELIADRDGHKVESVVRSGRFNPEVAVVASLVQAEVLEYGPRKLLGFGMRRTIERDPEPKRRIRGRLAEVFAWDRAPTAGDATILAALYAMGVAAQLLHDLSDAESADEFETALKALVARAPRPGGEVSRAVLDLQLARGVKDPRGDTPGTGGSGPVL